MNKLQHFSFVSTVLYYDNNVTVFFFYTQVNLTVDCTTVDGSDEPLPLPAPPPPRLARGSLRPSLLFDRTASLIPGHLSHRDSVSSASGLGLEPAMQATLFAFSHILRPANSRDSISSDGKHSPRTGILESFLFLKNVFSTL